MRDWLPEGFDSRFRFPIPYSEATFASFGLFAFFT